MDNDHGITDELRKFAPQINGYKFLRPCDERELRAIADRIDAELAERYVEIPAKVEGPPKDIDGEIWHYGDKAKSVLFPERAPRTVCGFGVINGRYVLFYLSKDCSGHTSELHQGWDYADSMRRYHKPTVEDVLDEFVERWHDTHHDDIPALKAEYAAKLRLADDWKEQ